ncbi:MAG: hypothetical protein U0992_09625 [Planctomycetaceae bacterium]
MVLADMSMMSTDATADDLADLVAELGERAEAGFAVVAFGGEARRADAERHVGVLGIGDDELAASIRIGMDGGELAVEGFHRRQFLSVRLSLQHFVDRVPQRVAGLLQGGQFFRPEFDFQMLQRTARPTMVGTLRRTSWIP